MGISGDVLRQEFQRYETAEYCRVRDREAQNSNLLLDGFACRAYAYEIIRSCSGVKTSAESGCVDSALSGLSYGWGQHRARHHLRAPSRHDGDQPRGARR